MTKSHAKPSAGMTGIKVGSTPIKIVGYGCGNDTVPVAVTETKRLMEKLNADVMVGPLSGDEAVYVANYAKAHPTKTFIIGTAGSQDPTMQIAPKNLFRYHGDGAQWNAGIGEIAYKKLGWRKAAIIMDDYSFGWTSAAGMIADFCAVGGNIVKRVFPPLNTTDYAPFVRQLPTAEPGGRLLLGRRRHRHARAAEGVRAGLRQARPEASSIGNLFFGFLGADKVVAPKVVGAYVGGFGNSPGVHYPKVDGVPSVCEEVDVPEAAPGRPVRLQLLHGRQGAGPRACRSPAAQVGAKLAGRAAAVDRRGRSRSRTAARSSSTPVARRSRTSTSSSSSRTPTGRWARRWSRTYRASISRSAVSSSRRARRPGRTQPPCKKLKTPWQGKIKVVTNGKVTTPDPEVGA